MYKGRLIVISGPSGVGKSVIVDKILNERDICYSISMTTRDKRDKEKDGVNYYFVTKKEFEHKIETGKMLEYATYNGNYYGTPKDKIDEKIKEGKDVLCEIEVEGARQIKKLYPDNSILIFIMPPSMEILESRLTNRNTENNDVIAKRMSIAKREIDNSDFYDYKIVNQDIDDAVNEILKII